MKEPTLEKPKFTKIMVEIDNKTIVNITDLPKELYEKFLQITNDLRLGYTLIIESRSQKK